LLIDGKFINKINKGKIDWISKRKYKEDKLEYEYIPKQVFSFSTLKKIDENTCQFNRIAFFSNSKRESLEDHKKSAIYFIKVYCENFMKRTAMLKNDFKISNKIDELKDDSRGKYLLDVDFNNF
jgi:hypothetical protein